MIYKQILVVSMALLTAGCSTFSKDGGIDAVNALTRSRIQQDSTWLRSEPETQAARASTRELLTQHYRDEIVPLRKNISEEVLLRYNANLMSVFELLADARQQIAAVSATIDAQRDFWLAETALNLALSGKSPGAMALSAGAAPMKPTTAEH